MSERKALRAVCYNRVSSQKQKDAHTIDSQLRQNEKFGSRQGWRLVREANFYDDDGRSAKAGRLELRGGFQRLLVDMEAGLFDVVIVVDDDRISRSEDLLERLEIYGRFKRAGVKIAISGTETIIDPQKSTDELLMMFKGWVSGEDNRKRRDNIVRGKIEAAHRGRKPAGITLFGLTYDKSKNDVPWGLHAENAPIVHKMYEDGLQMRSCRGLAEDLKKAGVPTPRGGEWSGARVYSILKNPAYRGEYTVDKARKLVVKVPRIVSDELWYAVQDALKNRRTYPSPRPRYDNLCERIAVCALCGSRIGISSNNKRHRYYLCATKKAPGKGVYRCPNPGRRVEQLDAQVWEAVVRVFEREDLLMGAVELRRSESSNANTDWSKELKQYEQRLRRLERAEAAILQRYRRGKVSAAAMDLELDSSARDRAIYERNIELAKQGLAAADRSKSEVEALMATVEELRPRLHTSSAKERQELIRLLVPGRDGCEIQIGPEQVEIVGLLSVRAQVRECSSTPLSA